MSKFLLLFRYTAESCFHPQQDWVIRWVTRLLIATLYLMGLYLWGQFLNWGDIPFGLLDWSDITIPRILVLQDAVQRGILPLHTLLPMGMKGVSDRFLAVPDILLSPQILLLKVLSPGYFLLINLVLLYTVGFSGLNQLRKKYNLSLLIFTVLFLIFNFNGHITGHLTAGHATWMAYFLWPFYFMLIVDLFEKPHTWDWIFRMAILSLVIFLQGGFHQFVYMMAFLILLGIFNSKLFKICILGVVASLAVCLFRILPGALIAADLKLEYLGGFTTSNEILRGFVTLVEPSALIENISRLNPYIAWWEFNYFTGWIGLIFMVTIPVLSWYLKSPQVPMLRAIFWPAFILGVFSVGRLYNIMFQLQIPLISSERIGSRFFVIPFLFALFLAVREAQWLLDRHFQTNRHSISPSTQLFFIGMLLLLINDIRQHTELWGVANVAESILQVPVIASDWVVSNHPDTLYTAFLILGLIISLISIAGLAVLRIKAPTAGFTPVTSEKLAVTIS
jgi:hypothetical protein